MIQEYILIFVYSFLVQLLQFLHYLSHINIELFDILHQVDQRMDLAKFLNVEDVYYIFHQLYPSFELNQFHQL